MADLRRLHQEWLDYVKPDGLVVTSSALAVATVGLAPDAREKQLRLLELCDVEDEEGGEHDLVLPTEHFLEMAIDLLGWQQEDLLDAEAIGSDLDVALPEYGDLLSPDFALVNPFAEEGSRWALLGNFAPHGLDFDDLDQSAEWNATPQLRLERLLREREVAIGLLVSEQAVRLVYAPRGESTGHITFPLAFMMEPAGRPVMAAFLALLCDERLIGVGEGENLLALMQKSREFQNEVSEKLAQQVLGALHALVRGIQAADERSGQTLLRAVLEEDPQHIYGGLLAVLLRLVFLLYAEDRGLLPGDGVYTRHYSVHALFERLRADAAMHPDTMDQRFGAWAQLLTVFRLVHGGAFWGEEAMPPRRGHLFNPDTYAFLEGRLEGSHASRHQRFDPPKVSDGVVLDVLRALLMLGDERLSYRTLDVEQIGSVYEYMMGFELERSKGAAIAIKAGKVPVFIDLDELAESEKAKKHLEGEYGIKVSTKVGKALGSADDHHEIVEALGKRIHEITPAPLPSGSLYLQPGEERRKSGSHYTPRELTAPIVEHTLGPILSGLGEHPTPEQILDLKVCDPAMGSGAFLVETVRYLADRLVESWDFHNFVDRTGIEEDEDKLLYARRLVAQRCIYGVDRNPFAVDLAKLSLWLFTMAKHQPFTFVDHALRHGDSLVGLSLDQLIDVSWDSKSAGDDLALVRANIIEKVTGAKFLREHILKKAEDDDQDEKRSLLEDADKAVHDIRLIGDVVISAFFAHDKKKARTDELKAVQSEIFNWLTKTSDGFELEVRQANLRESQAPFHWEIEFPEVFRRDNPGFDAFVGNPPFAGKNTISSGNGDQYIDWLQEVHEGAHGNSDLCAHFFRRCFTHVRDRGAYGLIATNTIAQGDTRATSLEWICTHGGDIYRAIKRKKWPGLASVIVSIINVFKGSYPEQPILNGRAVNRITAFLFHDGKDTMPSELILNKNIAFVGANIFGAGFTFDDKKTGANSLEDMNKLLENEENHSLIKPYIGGSHFNKSPDQKPRRFVIDFGDMDIESAKCYEDLFKIIESKVKPQREAQKRASRKKYWWRFAERAVSLYSRTSSVKRLLCRSLTGNQNAFAFLDVNLVHDQTLICFVLDTNCVFSVLQSTVHQIWADFFGGTIKDDSRYSITSSFETFPAPIEWDAEHEVLEEIGERYYEYRAQLMIENDEGLTTTYNRFHDPEESDPGILKLRELHEEMDRAVLAAYGWEDIDTTCEWQLLYDMPEGSRKKEPWRWQWPEEVHDEVLSRLVALNATRAAEEKGKK